MYKLLILLLILHCSLGEWYSSLGHMEDLVSEEQNLISSLRDFISAEEAKLEKLKNVATQLESQADEAGSNMEKFLGKQFVRIYLFKFSYA